MTWGKLSRREITRYAQFYGTRAMGLGNRCLPGENAQVIQHLPQVGLLLDDIKPGQFAVVIGQAQPLLDSRDDIPGRRPSRGADLDETLDQWLPFGRCIREGLFET